MALMFLSMFASGGIVIASMAYATGVYSSRDGGLIAGVGAGSWSALVAVMMPWFGAMFDGRRYGWAFVAAALCPPVGWVVWQLLSGRVEKAAADRMVA